MIQNDSKNVNPREYKQKVTYFEDLLSNENVIVQNCFEIFGDYVIFAGKLKE